jgi:hypothetical protein
MSLEERALPCCDWIFVMHLDSNIVIALFTVVAALAAVVTACVLVWQTHSTVSNQAILQLIAFWQSQPLYPRIRGAAARTTNSLLRMQEEGHDVSRINMAHVDDMIDFFETISFLTKRRRIDPSRVLKFETTYQTFFLPMASYWVLHKDHILSAQREEATVWREYSNLMQRLLAQEKELSLDEARAFVDDECFRCSP